jgi:predicted nucleic acid-binding Zn ribbon protein
MSAARPAKECPVCHGTIRPKGEGRTPVYCGDKCRKSAWRYREKQRDQEAKRLAGFVPTARRVLPRPKDEQGYLETLKAASGDVACRVCEERPATIGPPGNPLLCSACARA